MLISFPRDKVTSGPVQVVECRIGDIAFGIEANQIIEIVHLPKTTDTSQSDLFFRGVTQVRGHFIPVIDLRSGLGIQELGFGKLGRAVILDFSGIHAGIYVDSVLTKLSEGERKNADISGFGLPPAWIAFCVMSGDKHLPVLAHTRLVTDEQKKTLENIQQTF